MREVILAPLGPLNILCYLGVAGEMSEKYDVDYYVCHKSCHNSHNSQLPHETYYYLSFKIFLLNAGR